MASKNFFKIDQGLNLPSKTLPVSPSEGDIAKDITDGKFKFYQNGTWNELGSGGGTGAGSLDVMHSETAETAVLGDFTQTGLEISEDNPIHNLKVFRLVHQGASTRSFKKEVPVDLAFRGIPMTMMLKLRSSSTDGNVTVLFRDETNNVDLQQAQQLTTGAISVASLGTTNANATVTGFSVADIGKIKPGMTVTGTGIQTGTIVEAVGTSSITLSQNANATGTVSLKFSTLPKSIQLGFKIPDNCETISYTISALQESGSPETYVDDIVIQSFWTGTSVQGQTTITVPKIEQQSSFLNSSATVNNNNVTGALTSTNGTGVYSYNSGTGIYTMLKDAEVNISATMYTAAASTIVPTIRVNEVTVASVNTLASSGTGATVTHVAKLAAGDTFYCRNNTNVNSNQQYISVTATAITSQSVASTDLVPAKALNGSATIEVPVITRDYIRHSSAISTLVDNTGEARFNLSNLTASSNGIIVIEDDASNTRTKFVAQKECSITLSADFVSSAINANVGFYLNGSIIQTSTQQQTASKQVQGSLTLKLSAGDYVTLAFNSADSASLLRVFIVAEAYETESKTWSSTQTLVTEVPDSFLRFNDGNGFGSTNTFVRRFQGLQQVMGDAILWTDSATLGSYFTAQRDGFYTFNYSERTTANFTNASIFISKNADLSDPLSQSGDRFNTAATDPKRLGVAWTGYLTAGEIIYCGSNPPGNTNGTEVALSVSYQGKLKQIETVSDQKIEIPTSETRFEGSSSRGGTDTFIMKFNAVSKLRGDAFTIVNTSANGTYVQMTKSGKLSVSASVRINTAGHQLQITRNQQILTTYGTQSEVLAQQGAGTSSASNNLAWSGHVSKGDIIRLCSDQNPQADSTSLNNIMNFFFEEKEVEVSVSNVLPQFSDSDSFMWLSGANGFGSSLTNNRRFASVKKTQGKAIEYVDSSTEGANFIAKEEGLFDISYTETSSSNVVASYINILINGEVVAYDNQIYNTANANGKQMSASVQFYLNKGDIVTATVAAAAQNNGSDAQFQISKVGKPNVTGVDVTPFIDIPQPDFSFLRFAGSVTKGGTDTAILRFSSLTNRTGNAFSVSDSSANGTVITVTKNGILNINATVNTVTQTPVFISRNQSTALTSNPTNTSEILASTIQGVVGNNSALSWEGPVSVGDVIRVTSGSASINTSYLNLQHQALSDQILTEPETFSTDTANLRYASSSEYTLSTLQNAPVGTFITFTQTGGGIGTTRIQTNTAPTQATSNMNTNGIQLFTRVYAATSTSNSPATIAMQIGKGLKGIRASIFKSSGKITSGVITGYQPASSALYGLILTEETYDENTGVVIIDAGLVNGSATTLHEFMFNDGSTQTSGYLVINASKNPSLIGITKEIVSARAVNTSGQVITNGGTTSITYDTIKTYDTHGGLNTSTGVFTAPSSGFYTACWNFVLASSAGFGSGESFYSVLTKNGVDYSYGYLNYGEAATTKSMSTLGASGVYLNEGDTLNIYLFQNSGANVSLNTGSGNNYFSVHKTSIG